MATQEQGRVAAARPVLSVKKLFWGIWVVVLTVLQTSCFDPQSGCLDIAATNFNASADKNCCCKYPQLVLNLNQFYDTLLFRQDSLYPGTGGHLFRLKSVAFYTSEFQFFRDAESFRMGDSTLLKYQSGNDTLSRYFLDDFTLVRSATLKNEVASFREDGLFDQFRFRLGLNPEAEKIISALAPSGHPLRPQTENLSQNGYVFLQAIVARDSIADYDTLNFQRADIGDFFIQGTGSFRHDVGYDFPMTLTADWKLLFEGVDWSTHDVAAWKSQIVVNLPSVFSVSQ